MTVGFRDTKATLTCKAPFLWLFCLACSSPLPPEPCKYAYTAFQWVPYDSADVKWRNLPTNSTLTCP